MGTVVSIHRVSERDAPAVALETARFIADLGLEGDWRHGRQITLIEAEALDAVAAQLGLPRVPPGASRRQVVVRGLSLNAMVGRRLRVGELLVDVYDRCDPCQNMESKVGAGAMRAMKDRGGVCGRIIEGGVLRPGDPVTVVG